MRRIARAARWMLVALCVTTAAGAFGVQPPSVPASAQGATATVTPTPTPRPGARLRLTLKGVNRNSPDGAGTIAAQFRSQDDGEWGGATFEWLPSPETVKLAREKQGGRLRAEFVFFEETPNGPVEVYRHVERNAPFCAFGDRNGRCNPMPIVNGVYRWPDSDGKPGSGSPVKPGRYTLEINGFAYVDGDEGNFFGNWNSAPQFTIEFEEVTELPALAGRAAITSPRSGATLRGIVNLRGTATANNFGFYKFELVDPRCESSVCFVADGKRPVSNGLLLRWDTRTIPNGNYMLQLVVVDKFGRALPNPPRIRIRVQN
ncbi:MAG: hypothetical protein ACFLMY_02955 [Candidatus Brachytrichaceae bacterium NZ_4S206]